MAFPELADRFIADLERDGATVIVEGAIAAKPARMRVITTEKLTDCLVFLWNITPGGGPNVRKPYERRIQVTAADNGLIGFRPDYRIVENPRIIARLDELNFLRGIDEFRGMLRPAIRHPAQMEVRPKPEYLRRGMELRSFAPELIG